jgi:hypothetical protein
MQQMQQRTTSAAARQPDTGSRCPEAASGRPLRQASVDRQRHCGEPRRHRNLPSLRPRGTAARQPTHSAPTGADAMAIAHTRPVPVRPTVEKSAALPLHPFGPASPDRRKQSSRLDQATFTPGSLSTHYRLPSSVASSILCFHSLAPLRIAPIVA